MVIELAKVVNIKYNTPMDIITLHAISLNQPVTTVY